MKKSYLFAIIPFIITIICYVIVIMNPDVMDADGTLHESFGAKAIGSISFFIGVISTIVLIVRALYLKHK